MVNQADATNYYEILEVAADAPPHEIHKAYQRAKATYSTDNPALYSMFSPDEARELLRLIEEAYTVLGNPGMRKTYDEARARGETPPRPFTQSAPAKANDARASEAPSPQIQHQQPAPRSAPQVSISQPVTQQASAAQIANDHRALPDFATPELAETFAPRSPSAPASNVKATLPPGTGRTSLSTYKIDDHFESELANATDFDGNMIQRARLYKNISIDRMSEATRISRPYLMAIETNDYKNLPAAVFTRGFIVQISKILGLPDAKVASSYIKMFKAGGGK